MNQLTRVISFIQSAADNSDSIELSPADCQMLSAELARLETLIEYYYEKIKRLRTITDPNLYEIEPNRYEVQK